MLEIPPKQWHRDNFLISTEPSLLQPAAINAAFASDQVYWAKVMPTDVLEKMLRDSLCFGLYALPASTAEIAGRSQPPQVGFARVVTDGVTFAYLTDVYVLPEHQGKGLGRWLTTCVQEVFDSWPHLRRSALVTTDGRAVELYRELLRMRVSDPADGGIIFMTAVGKGSVLQA